MNALIRNIPVIVLMIMISTCVFVDVTIVSQPRHLLSKIPIAIVAIAYTIFLNTRPRGEKGK